MTAIEDARAALVRLDEYKRTLSGRITADDLACQLRALIFEHEHITRDRDLTAAENAELLRENLALTAPPTDDEREALVEAYLEAHGHHADAEHGFRAGLALRRQGPITRNAINAAALELYGVSATYDPEKVRAALEAAERAR